MGEISGKYSDLTIVTEDNSRFEDVHDIMNDIEIGISKTNGKYIKIGNRTEAIKYARENYYDFIISVADFWQDYLVKENGKYFLSLDGYFKPCSECK